ncbi:MAG: acyltransferase family protein [Bacilli bacterium]|nr:acyltransferase family protein [Bacilli bacterium]
MKDRDNYIDILKSIGLLCIIIAHINPPEIVFRIRNFDVVLMILISANLAIKSKKINNWKKYAFIRFKRLILPTWIFLIIFFIINIFSRFIDLSLKNILLSFALSNYGIGYVWIIRIYFMISLIVLLFKLLQNKINIKVIYIMSILLYILYEILFKLNAFNNIIIDYLFAYIIPCILLVTISEKMFNDKRCNIIITSISLIIFATYTIYKYIVDGIIISTQVFKYPFRFYYLSYGIFVTGLLIMLTKNKKLYNISENRFLKYVSENSLWIYLWHILILYSLNAFKFTWYIKLIIVIILSLMIVYIQKKIVNIIEKKVSNKSIVNIFK